MTEQLPLPFTSHSRGTFAVFVRGKNAELVDRLKQSPRTFECLWLFGEPGTGKTHLLQAICEARENAAYIPAGEIDTEHDSISAYGKFDTVTVDDVTEWIGGAASERPLMDLYNGLRDRQRRLVVTADRSPRDVRFAIPDLGSRLRAAECYRIEALDDRDKLRLLSAIASERGFDLPEEVAQFLLARTSRDQRELLGALDRLDQASLAEGRRLTIPFVKQTLKL